jgi:hypothetical protein
LSLSRTPSPRTSVRLHRAVTASAAAITATAAVAAGVLTASVTAHTPASPALAQARHQGQLASHTLPLTSTTEHVELDVLLTAGAVQVTANTAATAAPTPRQIALSLLHRFGWSARQFPPLNRLWSRESSWRVHAFNAYSGAYGIPQAVPGVKMSTAGPNWRTSARTQILWGLRYIKARYGSPAAAWRHELATGWY